MRGNRRLLLVIILIALFTGLTSTGSAQAPDELYFPETGHTVAGSFLDYYQGLKDPLLLLGFPITDSYYDKLSGREVQYFQKGRLELVNNDGFISVRQAALGQLMHDEGAAVAAVETDSPSCHYFTETGHSVCYAFWQFYDGYDGETTLGLPISDVEVREMRMVQYFEKARLEWHPENPSGQRVLVTDLGRIYFDKVVGDQSKIYPQPPDFIHANRMELKAEAFVSSALAAQGETQTVSVVVMDQYLRPVENAGVALVITYPNGRQDVLAADSTNADGLTQAHFTVGEAEARQMVTIAVTVLAQDQQAHANTWFRVWW